MAVSLGGLNNFTHTPTNCFGDNASSWRAKKTRANTCHLERFFTPGTSFKVVHSVLADIYGEASLNVTGYGWLVRVENEKILMLVLTLPLPP